MNREEIAEQVAKECNLILQDPKSVPFTRDSGLIIPQKVWDALISARVELAEREPPAVEDGFGSVWPPCSKHHISLDVMRPGDACCHMCQTEDYIDRLIADKAASSERVKELSQALRKIIDAVDRLRPECLCIQEVNEKCELTHEPNCPVLGARAVLSEE